MADLANGEGGVACTAAALEIIVDLLNEASFSDDKKAYVRTVCQNFVFNTEQVAAMLDTISMSGDKMEALDLFSGSITDPSHTEPIAAVFSMSSDQAEAAEKVSSFAAQKPVVMADYPIENDGHRSPEDMDRLIAAIADASMSDDKVAVVAAEVESNPNPPFDVHQLIRIMAELNFTDAIIAVLDLLVGPALVYPFTCEEAIAVLDQLNMSNDKIAVLPSLKPYIKDAQNKLLIVSSFTFSSDKSKAEEILRDLVIRIRPKTPPQAQIQAALKRIGTCSSGYAWRKVTGGYRCSAGGHYVSDAALEAAM